MLAFCTGYHDEGYMLLYCIVDTKASAALLNQPAAVAIARWLAATDSEVGRLRLLLRVHASLIKVWCGADMRFCIRHIYTQAEIAWLHGNATCNAAVLLPSRVCVCEGCNEVTSLTRCGISQVMPQHADVTPRIALL
jgi:hypothetical protein